MPSTPIPTWVLLGLLSATFAAAVAVLGKIGLEGVDSTLATAVRAVVMALATLALAGATGRLAGAASLSGRALAFISLSGLAGAASWIAYFAALRAGPAGGVAALDRLSIVFVVLLSAVFLGEGLTLSKGVGAILIVAGALLIAR